MQELLLSELEGRKEDSNQRTITGISRARWSPYLDCPRCLCYLGR